MSHDELGLGCMPLGLAEAQGTLADIASLQGKGGWLGFGSFLQNWERV